MNILFCGDRGVCQGVFLSAFSICKNTKEDVTFYILTASVADRNAIPDSFAKKLQHTLSRKGYRKNLI